MTAVRSIRGGLDQLRAWLEFLAQYAIDWLDDLDAGAEDREDDEAEVVCEDD